MKDINLNDKTTDPGTANNKEDLNSNEKNVNNNYTESMKADTEDTQVKELESSENGKEETGSVSDDKQNEDVKSSEATAGAETVGANTDDAGKAGGDTAAVDTDDAEKAGGDAVVADTAVADTAVADTTVADTAVADTASADTAGADTTSADIAVADTTSADIAVADTAIADIASAGLAGADTAVADTAGAGIAGADTAGTDTAGTDSAGADKADAEEPSVTSQASILPYKYKDDQWSPLNKDGKRQYDVDFLKQVRKDPKSKKKPEAPKLEQCKLIRDTPITEVPIVFTNLGQVRPTSDALFPNFLKVSSGGMSKRSSDRDNRNTNIGRGSMKITSSPSRPGNSPMKHNVIHVSLHDNVKLNETENAWKPNRFKKSDMDKEEAETQELYKKFRGILNKLTPQKFNTLLEKVKGLKIDTQKRLEGVIDLVFEKAIEEPNFSEAYAVMCSKLSTLKMDNLQKVDILVSLAILQGIEALKVPAANATGPDQYVNFRVLIIHKCQAQFVTTTVDERVKKLETELAESTDPAKKKELQLILNEENRKARMRAVANVRFIGELFKLKMLVGRTMVYCMNYLIDKLDEEKLECLCKLLTTIGQLVESEKEVKENLDNIFKKMQDIINKKSNKISSRVRFMMQDVIELRRRRWVAKGVVDLQPRRMDQIQKEAEQQHRQTEMLNSNIGGGGGGGGGGHRRDDRDGGRGKRGDSRRNQSYMDSGEWKTTTRHNYTSVDTSKLKAASNNKSLENIKLAPQKSQWGHGSSAKSSSTTGPVISLGTSNKYSVLDVHNDPPSIRGDKESGGYHSKGASIERSTFNSRDFGSSNNRPAPRQTAGSQSTNAAPVRPSTPPVARVSPQPAVITPTETKQEPLTDQQKALAKSVIQQCVLNSDDNEMAQDFKRLFQPSHQAGIILEIVNMAVERPVKEIAIIAKSVLHLVSTNTVTPENFLAGLTEVFDMAPEYYIDIPMLYDYLSMFIAPQIEKKHVTFAQILKLSGNIIAENHGHLILKALLRDLKVSMGPTFAKSKWLESALELKQWMKEDQVKKFIEDNKFEFLEAESDTKQEVVVEEKKEIITPTEATSKMLQLMNADESCECIRGWVKDNVGAATNEDWFMKSLMRAICEHALVGPNQASLDLNQERMNKYSYLINDYGDSKERREANCLIAIQQLIHKLEHPRGLTLEIFQYLYEQYIISVEGFLTWEASENDPEGKGVMIKALTSFFTSIKEGENDDSSSED